VGTNGLKNIDWFDTDNRWTLKNIDYIKWPLVEKNLKPMIDTIGQKLKLFNQRFDAIGGQHDQ
jgi:hypothetical protein